MIKLKPKEITYWFNAIRNVPEHQRTRALDAFWSGQLDSKVWLVEEINKINYQPSDVYIFGGWIGVLSSILLQSSKFPITKLFSIDIDPWCEDIANTVCQPYRNNIFKAITSDMGAYEYETTPTIVINTSTEHVTQDVYDSWYNNIPNGTLVIIQGNDFFACDEHIRCSDNLNSFITQNHVINPLFAGELQTDLYKRFMCIWKK